MECTTFGYLLFSQPAEYGLAYSDGRKRVVSPATDSQRGGGGSRDDTGRRSEKIVVCPGLQRLGDEEGRRHASPQILMCPVVAEAWVGGHGQRTSRNTVGAAI